jgi:hypothetical protein
VLRKILKADLGSASVGISKCVYDIIDIEERRGIAYAAHKVRFLTLNL